MKTNLIAGNELDPVDQGNEMNDKKSLRIITEDKQVRRKQLLCCGIKKFFFKFNSAVQY